MPVAEGRAVPPVPPSQVRRSNRWTHRCCLFLLPTHPVYLKRPQDKITHGTHEREADPAPSPRGRAASFSARSPCSDVSCSVITNICSPLSQFPTGPGAAGEEQSAASPPGNTACTAGHLLTGARGQTCMLAPAPGSPPEQHCSPCPASSIRPARHMDFSRCKAPAPSVLLGNTGFQVGPGYQNTGPAENRPTCCKSRQQVWSGESPGEEEVQLLPLCLLPLPKLCLLLEAGREGRRRWGKQLPTFTLPSPAGDACRLGTETVKPARNPFLAGSLSPTSKARRSHAHRELRTIISPQITHLPAPRLPRAAGPRQPHRQLPAPAHRPAIWARCALRSPALKAS